MVHGVAYNTPWAALFAARQHTWQPSMALAEPLEPRSWAKVTLSVTTSLTLARNSMCRKNFRRNFRPTRENLAAIFAFVKRNFRKFRGIFSNVPAKASNRPANGLKTLAAACRSIFRRKPARTQMRGFARQ